MTEFGNCCFWVLHLSTVLEFLIVLVHCLDGQTTKTCTASGFFKWLAEMNFNSCSISGAYVNNLKMTCNETDL